MKAYLIGVLMGAVAATALQYARHTPPVVCEDCEGYRVAADRCSSVALTCLSYQILMKQEIEELQRVCAPK